MIYGFPYNTLITAAAASKNLTTVEAVKAALGITASTPEIDAWIASQIPAASGAIVAWCKREFAQEEILDRFRLGDQRAISGLYLSRSPIADVLEVTEAGAPVTAAGFEIGARKGVLWRTNSSGEPSSWPQGRLITVKHKSGYALPDELPPEVQAVCTALVKAMYFAVGRDPTIRSMDAPDVGSVTFNGGSGAAGTDTSAPGLLGQFAGPLDPYRNWAPP